MACVVMLINIFVTDYYQLTNKQDYDIMRLAHGGKNIFQKRIGTPVLKIFFWLDLRVSLLCIHCNLITKCHTFRLNYKQLK